MRKFEEKTITTEKIYDGKIIDVQIDEVELSNGKKAKRELVSHPGAVAVIPITKDNKIVLVEQYRKPLEKSIIEIPAGKVEKGEQPELTALRELEEETGYTARELSFVTSFYTSPGFADELMQIFITDELEQLESPVEKDEDEFIEVLELSLDEAKQLVEEKRIHDAKTNYAILYLHALERK
ncbi:NUDIX hydrolase [Virgibacillus oceani]